MPFVLTDNLPYQITVLSFSDPIPDPLLFSLKNPDPDPPIYHTKYRINFLKINHKVSELTTNTNNSLKIWKI